MTEKTKAQLFAEAVNEALAPEDSPRAEPETPAGPRRPAPVPEVGSTTAPGHREASRLAAFRDLFGL